MLFLISKMTKKIVKKYDVDKTTDANKTNKIKKLGGTVLKKLVELSN